MSRISFTSTVVYHAVVEPLGVNEDKGIKTHNAVRAFFQNLAAKIFEGLFSPIVEYTFRGETLYLNVKSFNNWLGRCGLDINKPQYRLERDKTDNQIADLIGYGRAWKIRGKPRENVEQPMYL